MPRKAKSGRPLTVSIIGPGSLGTALALTLPSAGYSVAEIVTRSLQPRTRSLARRVKARVLPVGSGLVSGDIVWVTVPDDVIATTAAALAVQQNWKGKTVFHSSGALTSDELAPLRTAGASVASVHPQMTFVPSSVPGMKGVPFAIEGDDAAVRVATGMIRRLGAKALTIEKRNKVLYHAFGSFASPLVIALLASLEKVAEAAGVAPADVKPVMAPLFRQTVHNYFRGSAAEAFSGPLIRGDVATIRKHLAELKAVPEAREVYVALARSAVKNLPVKNRAELEKALRTK